MVGRPCSLQPAALLGCDSSALGGTGSCAAGASAARRSPKETAGRALAGRTETAYEAFAPDEKAHISRAGPQEIPQNFHPLHLTFHGSWCIILQDELVITPRGRLPRLLMYARSSHDEAHGGVPAWPPWKCLLNPVHDAAFRQRLAAPLHLQLLDVVGMAGSSQACVQLFSQKG